MAKPTPKPDFGGMIDLPEDPSGDEQEQARTTVQSYERTAVPRKAAKRRAGRAKAPVASEPRDYVQRSLYAREETFERIRRYAFEQRRPAQELYREGLFLLLKKYKLDDGLTPDDV